MTVFHLCIEPWQQPSGCNHLAKSLSTQQSSFQIHLSPIQRKRYGASLCQRPCTSRGRVALPWSTNAINSIIEISTSAMLLKWQEKIVGGTIPPIIHVVRSTQQELVKTVIPRGALQCKFGTLQKRKRWDTYLFSSEVAQSKQLNGGSITEASLYCNITMRKSLALRQKHPAQHATGDTGISDYKEQSEQHAFYTTSEGFFQAGKKVPWRKPLTIL